MHIIRSGTCLLGSSVFGGCLLLILLIKLGTTSRQLFKKLLLWSACSLLILIRLDIDLAHQFPVVPHIKT